MLRVHELEVSYGGIAALRGVTLEVEAGEFVALVGANGAGKSTLLRAISGLCKPCGGRIQFEGREIAGLSVEVRARSGLVHVPEGRRIFPTLTVRENLLLGAWGLHRNQAASGLARVEELFPLLGERAGQLGFSLSGGEQQMLAIGRALMRDPKCLMLDEPSMGLAPKIVKQIFVLLSQVNAAGTTVLLVEQNARMALECAHRAYVIDRGRIVHAGEARALAETDEIRRAYLGA